MEQRLQKASSIASRVGGVGGGMIGQIGGGIGAFGLAGGAAAAGIFAATTAWNAFAEAAEKANQIAKDATKDTYDYLDKQAKSREMKRNAYNEFAKTTSTPIKKIIAKGGISSLDTVFPLLDKGYQQEDILNVLQETAGSKLKNKREVEWMALELQKQLGMNAPEMIKKALLRPSTRMELEEAGINKNKIFNALGGKGTSEQYQNLVDYYEKYKKDPYPTGGLTDSMKKEKQRHALLRPVAREWSKSKKIAEQQKQMIFEQEEVSPEILKALSQVERNDLRFIMANKLGVRYKDVPGFSEALADEPDNFLKRMSDRAVDSPELARAKYEQGLLGKETEARDLSGRYITPEYVEDETKTHAGWYSNSFFRFLPWFNEKTEDYSEYKREQIEREMNLYIKRTSDSDNQAVKVLKEINENFRVKRTEP